MATHNLPIRIEYNGLDAKHDMLELRELSISLGGASKLLRMSSHLLFAGEIPSKNAPVRTKFYAKPVEAGCFPVEIIGSIDGDLFGITSEVIAGLGAEIIQRLMTIAILMPSGRSKETAQHFEALMELTKQIQQDKMASQEMLISRWAESESRMFEMAKMLADRGHSATIDAVHPIGRTCSEQSFGNQNKGGVIVDLPTAQSIRSGLKLEIGDMAEYNVTLDGVIIHNRTCRLYVEGEGDRVITGDLVDPVADEWPNI